MHSGYCRNNVKKLAKNDTHTTKKKMTNIVNYRTNLIYKLCLSPTHDVSENPSFESILYDFSKAKK